MKRTAMLVLSAAVFAACSTGGPRIDPGGFHASDRVGSNSLPVAVATADIVVVATFKEVGPGPVTEVSKGRPITHLTTVLSVEQAIKANESLVGADLTVVTLEAAYKKPHTEWRVTGSKVVAFLDRSPEGNPWYITTNWSQSVFLISTGKLQFVTAFEDSGFVAEMAKLSLAEFKQQAEEAKEMIAKGEVQPNPKPTVGDPPGEDEGPPAPPDERDQN